MKREGAYWKSRKLRLRKIELPSWFLLNWTGAI